MCGSFIAVALQNEQTWLKHRSWFVHNKYLVSSINLLLLSIIWLQRYVTKYKNHGICKFINFVSIWYSTLYMLHSQSTTLLPILIQVTCLTTLIFVASLFNLNWFLCWNVFLSFLIIADSGYIYTLLETSFNHSDSGKYAMQWFWGTWFSIPAAALTSPISTIILI